MIFWSAVCLVLSGIIVFQIDDPPWRPVKAAASGTSEEHDRDRGDLLQLRPVPQQIPSTIIDRPLFFETRRPFTPEPEKKAAVIKKRTVKKPSFELAGTMSSGKRRAALLITPDRGLIRLPEGASIDGWQVEDVQRNEIRLRQDDETLRLQLRSDF